MRSKLASRVLNNVVKLRGAVIVPLGVGMILVSLVGLVVVDYLFETYGQSSLPVVILASLIVAATVSVSYWQGKRICARKRLAARSTL
jgi:hypothetical protein